MQWPAAQAPPTYPPFTAFEDETIAVVFKCSKLAGQAAMTDILAELSTTHTAPITNVTLQAAVPKVGISRR